MWLKSRSSSRRLIASALLCLAAAAPLGAQATREKEKEKGREKREASGPETHKRDLLWAPVEPIAFTLTFDRSKVYGDRDTLSTQTYPATITWTDSAGAPHDLTVALRTRGHFRRLTTNCSTPPLRLLFDKTAVKGTPFTGQRNLKLVNACRDGSEYDEYIRREYAVYRVHNVVSDWSFHARLATVTYADARKESKSVTHTAMLLEHDDDVGSRHDADVWKQKTGLPRMDDTDPFQMEIAAVFLYFVGNTDWSVPGRHNITLFQREGQDTIFPVPYDYDWSGIVQTKYSFPDKRLPITSVRQRLYRGPCRSPEQLAPVFQRFRERRTAIEAVYTTQPGLSPDYVKNTLSYINEFYKTIDDPKSWKSEMERRCVQDRS